MQERECADGQKYDFSKVNRYSDTKFIILQEKCKIIFIFHFSLNLLVE
jgi:hypothetical protein